MRWREAPKEYGPHKALYNRWKQWSDKGIIAQVMVGLAADHSETKTVMINANYLKARRTATSMGVKKRDVAALSAGQEQHERIGALDDIEIQINPSTAKSCYKRAAHQKSMHSLPAQRSNPY